MTIEAKIFTAIKGLCGNRAFPDVAPLATAKPYVTYTQVGGESMASVSGVLSARHGRFQINVWGGTRSECTLLMLQIESALIQSNQMQARPVGSQQGSYDHDMLIYGAMQDFSIYQGR